jgi:hypothetical protein
MLIAGERVAVADLQCRGTDDPATGTSVAEMPEADFAVFVGEEGAVETEVVFMDGAGINKRTENAHVGLLRACEWTRYEAGKGKAGVQGW